MREKNTRNVDFKNCKEHFYAPSFVSVVAPDELYYVDVNVITNDLCDNYYGSTITDNLVCAGDYMDGDGDDFDDKDACQVGTNKQMETIFLKKLSAKTLLPVTGVYS